MLLATNSLLIAHAQEARNYALVPLAVVVATMCFVRAVDDPRRRMWLLYAVAAASSVYCHFFAGFVVMAQLVSLPFAPVRPPVRRVVEAGAAFAALILPALYFTATATRAQIEWIDPPTVGGIWQMFHDTTGGNLALAAAGVGGLVVLALRRDPVDRWRFALLTGWWGLPLALALGLSWIQSILVPKYAIVVAPAIALAAAVGLLALWHRGRVVATAALLIIVVAAGIRIGESYARNDDDWRGAAAFVERERSPADVVVVSPSWATPPYDYYAPRPVVTADAAEHRAFVVLYQSAGTVTAELVREALAGKALALVQQREFGANVSVRVYERRR